MCTNTSTHTATRAFAFKFIALFICAQRRAELYTENLMQQSTREINKKRIEIDCEVRARWECEVYLQTRRVLIACDVDTINWIAKNIYVIWAPTSEPKCGFPEPVGMFYHWADKIFVFGTCNHLFSYNLNIWNIISIVKHHLRLATATMRASS